MTCSVQNSCIIIGVTIDCQKHVGVTRASAADKDEGILKIIWHALRTDGHIIARPHVTLGGAAWEGQRQQHAEGDKQAH